MSRKQNWVTVTLVVYFTKALTPRYIPLKQDPGPHQNHKTVKNSSREE